MTSSIKSSYGTWAFGRQSPDNNLMHWVSKRYPTPKRRPEWPVEFLDIGSGEGANARELEKRKHGVITVDKDPACKAQVTADICTLITDGFIGAFDCVYDVNTLCHVENPPFEKIKTWLKPEGFFFSICPQFGSASRVMEGKDFTRFLSLRDVEGFYGAFSEVRIGSHTSRLPGEVMYASWLVECRA